MKKMLLIATASILSLTASATTFNCESSKFGNTYKVEMKKNKTADLKIADKNGKTLQTLNKLKVIQSTVMVGEDISTKYELRIPGFELLVADMTVSSLHTFMTAYKTSDRVDMGSSTSDSSILCKKMEEKSLSLLKKETCNTRPVLVIDNKNVTYKALNYKTPILKKEELKKGDQNFLYITSILQTSDTDFPIAKEIASKTESVKLIYFEDMVYSTAVYGKLLDKKGNEIYRFYMDSSANFKKCL